MPCAHDIVHLHSIFVFDNFPTYNERWIKRWWKIKGIFAEKTLLCNVLKKATRQCQQTYTPISFVESDQKLNK